MKQILTLSLSVVLAACGGGSGGGSESSTSAPVQNNQPTIDTAHLDLINAAYARNLSIEGAGVTVAVIDSGVNVNHDEFGGKTLNQNSGSYVSAVNYYTLDELEAMELSGTDLYDPIRTGEQEDVFGHGTHVTSLTWGENVGVAPEADVLMLDVYPANNPDPLAAKGLIAEMKAMGVDFINASLTGVDYYEVSEFVDERPLFTDLDAQDMGFIVSGGNFGLDMTETFITNPVNCQDLPAEERDNSLTCKFIFDATPVTLLAKDVELADNFLWVGAVNQDRTPSEFLLSDGAEAGTNVPGDDADIQSRWISAPGTAVDGAFFDNNTEYLQVSGTSQAAPLVTGAAALVKGQFPALTNAAVLQILLDTADRSFEGYDPAVHGRGILDIEAALSVDSTQYEAL